MKVEIYGHSDDCLEVEYGTHTDEFSAYDAKKFLHFNDGTVVEAEFGPEDDGDYRWRIRPVKVGAGTTCKRVDGTYHGEDDGAKCDRLILRGKFLVASVRCYSSVDGPGDGDIEEFFDSFDMRNYTRKQLIEIMEMPKK